MRIIYLNTHDVVNGKTIELGNFVELVKSCNTNEFHNAICSIAQKSSPMFFKEHIDYIGNHDLIIGDSDLDDLLVLPVWDQGSIDSYKKVLTVILSDFYSYITRDMESLSDRYAEEFKDLHQSVRRLLIEIAKGKNKFSFMEHDMIVKPLVRALRSIDDWRQPCMETYKTEKSSHSNNSCFDDQLLEQFIFRLSQLFIEMTGKPCNKENRVISNYLFFPTVEECHNSISMNKIQNVLAKFRKQ